MLMIDLIPIQRDTSTNYAYYNDIDPYCCSVLRARIADGMLPKGYVDGRDIQELHATDFVGYQHVHLFAGIGGFPYGLQLAGFPTSIRVLTGGFPCQDISFEGNRAGLAGERSGLWKEMHRLIQESIDCQMAFDYILVENVAALLTPTRREDGTIEPAPISRVLGDLAACGYDAFWRVFSSAEFGAPHIRERIYIVAYTNSLRLPRGQKSRSSTTSWQETHQQPQRLLPANFWMEVSQSCLHRVDDGVSSQLHCGSGTSKDAPRTKALGNSVDPRIPQFLAQLIKLYEHHHDTNHANIDANMEEAV